ncbi:MAG: GNAT family N-acetyltransferase [SAR86 cluster bacterium]|uniref:GNAT family N-acetyltransferase n=1 Tax=SAR86 cluster bacterium TaxID=2030880 RepID=A0A2A4XCF5_9GAMM|nr:MAG: GNAT family N-acetyltransferase [SAR86 cluster bacterium]
MTTQIRTLAPGDLEWMISMHGLIYAREFNFNAEFEAGIAKKAARIRESDDPFNCIWIKQVDGQRAGSIAVSKLDDGAAFINFVLVLDEYRGRGIAMELMQHLIVHVRGAGINTIRLETYTCLEHARVLYKNLGFSIASSEKDCVRFGLTLTQEYWELRLDQ